MAGIDKIVIPQLGGENWSVWRAKFRALLEYKGLYIAIEQPESVEGRKALGQAKALMILHTQDADVKLFIGKSAAAKAWKKLEENFEKTSNARVVQLRKKLTSLTLTREKSIAEYVGEFREIKKKQKLKLEEELGAPEEKEEESMGKAFVANRERYETVNKGSNERGDFTGGVRREGGPDARTCYACGEKGHVRAHCRKRNAKCFNCGERGHISSVCRKPWGGAKSGGEDRPDGKEFAGVAFTTWRKEARVPANV
ncbi:hypothetical protein KFL_011690020 [Klebsormidium nitens]|uniref:CCHC-type domain-containing protein n=1 Tax=Klebsormidium nitens TaxID=105231 RepID=A0A1Y1IQ78_KLENI|nr:hypothetical protein KFL_011690020 [Klebsormidium nitens]|eukprot:GAQ92854.1 hypothetical protein KFL_011690020 [Klebsormidium nitens]